MPGQGYFVRARQLRTQVLQRQRILEPDALAERVHAAGHDGDLHGCQMQLADKLLEANDGIHVLAGCSSTAGGHEIEPSVRRKP